MRQTRSFVWLALGASLLAQPRARAEDFEFEVPVQLAKLDPVFTQGKVSCQVTGLDRDAGGGGSVKSLNAVIASGSTTFALVQGGFSGNVSVKFDAERPRRQPADGRAWSCILSIVAPSGSEPLCLRDSFTGHASAPRLPAILNLDQKSVKGCTQGTIAAK